MDLAVFGASGGVGRLAVQLAIARGHRVHAIYRTPPAGTTPLPSGEAAPGYLPFVAPVIDEEEFIAEAIAGVDAVISAVGLRRRHAINPWSSLTSPVDFTSRFATRLTRVMQRPGMPQRIIAISAAGVGDSTECMHPALRLLFQRSNIGRAYEDLDRMEQVYRDSSVLWTCVRPTTLMNRNRPPRPVREAHRYGLTDRIARVDVAQFLLDCLEDAGNNQDRRTLLITGGK